MYVYVVGFNALTRKICVHANVRVRKCSIEELKEDRDKY